MIFRVNRSLTRFSFSRSLSRSSILDPPSSLRSFTLPEQRARLAFTLIELLVVMGIIAIAMAFLIPSLSTSSGRAVDAAAGQLKADLESARLMAIAERTRTRVILPNLSSNFAIASASATPWPTDITLRGYVIVSERRTDSVWKQRGKWSRFPQGTALDFASSALQTPTPAPMQIDATGTGTTTSYNFSGPYIEFLSNGSSNLNPTVTPTPSAVIADGFVDNNGSFIRKKSALRYTITVDPLTGAVNSR